jgi:geranylgeranyl pyrophosphate synthase
MGLMLAECFGRDLSKVEDNKDIYFTCGITELIQNSPLTFDDTEDSSHTRRGDLRTYKKFGIDIAINARNSLYFAPIPKLDQFVQDEKLQ